MSIPNNPTATVTAINGEVFARDAAGNMRVLQAGDPVGVGEEIVTAAGASAEVTMPNGESMTMAGDQTMAVTDPMMDPTVETVLAALEGEGDLLDELDATAAGAGAGAGAGDDGAGFVSLDRIDETPDSSPEYTFTGSDVVTPVLSEDILPGTEEVLLGDDDDELPIGDDDDDDELPIGDDDDDDEPPIGDDDDDDGGVEAAAYAGSGSGFNAWLQNGNLNQFNATLVEHESGYGVEQSGQGVRTDGVDNNETLLLVLQDEASDVSININGLGDSVGGEIIFYDSDRVELHRITIEDAGEYSWSSEDGDIAFVVVSGTAQVNHDGFYVEFEAWMDALAEPLSDLDDAFDTDVIVGEGTEPDVE